ncbi:unnamed protein product [Ectocarpus sp. CCAP 1310/34]|nr:unnamed protein product [Ectocarpus sp. CCAP 1310/34]
MKEAGASRPAGGGEGALLRKLLSVEGGSDHAIKDVSNRMTLSDEEIVTQSKGAQVPEVRLVTGTHSS